VVAEEVTKMLDYTGLGWKVKLRQKRASYFCTLAKEIIVGNALKQGDELYYYLVNVEGRKGVLMFLDGGERKSRLS
jgi:hypothetical protein